MNALMICLLACAAATPGSRWAQLAVVALARLSGWRGALPVIGSAVVAAALAAAFGSEIAAQMRGPGMLLLLALALAFAAAGLFWPVRPLSDRLRGSITGPASAAILLLAAMVSDSAPFIILAATAWTGEAAFAAIGGAAGLVAVAMAMFSVQMNADELPRWATLFRRTCAAVMALISASCAIVALGIG